MDEKTKLYVFSKKEVALIFLFMIVTAITSFVVGVKMGKSFSYKESGLVPEDRQKVEILSGQEEMVNDVVEEHQEPKNESDKRKEVEDINLKLEEEIKEKINQDSSMNSQTENNLIAEKKKADSVETPSETKATTQNTVVPPVMDMAGADTELELRQVKDKYRGKYTIQLGSHRSLREAEEFAEGFKVRGYNPIINETEVPDRGTWFQVSLGAFESLSDTKEYIKKEYSLFQGQDYYIRRFD